MALLEVRDLRAGYGSLPVVNGISFDIEDRETAVVLGLNGAGKTTTVLAIAGLIKPLGGTLSGGEQQMLAIARGLMAGPRLLLIDEASLGLSPVLTETVFDVVQRINADGTTVLLVEQNAGALALAARALVMEKGHIAYRGHGEELLDDAGVRRADLGAPPLRGG